MDAILLPRFHGKRVYHPSAAGLVSLQSKVRVTDQVLVPGLPQPNAKTPMTMIVREISMCAAMRIFRRVSIPSPWTMFYNCSTPIWLTALPEMYRGPIKSRVVFVDKNTCSYTLSIWQLSSIFPGQKLSFAGNRAQLMSPEDCGLFHLKRCDCPKSLAR
jgi:hypothetical protein